MAFSALFTLVAVAAFPAVIHAVGVGSVLVGCLVLVVVLGEYRHRAQPADAEQARHDAH